MPKTPAPAAPEGVLGPRPDAGSLDPRNRPHAVRELATMFGDVSGRYDLLNRIMSLGRDRAWRRAMWSQVPAETRAVLDLCTGSGASLEGLRRPGRLVLGVDASVEMLGIAAGSQRRAGWAPRLLCADAFQLPLKDGSLDCVTIAFGARNLRPLDRALAEIARVLEPGGRLIVLEATAPRSGPIAPLHRFYLRRLVPLAGRLSPDPSAYEYLSRSIFEFGSGPEFEADLAAAGFELLGRSRFLLGATGLWVARSPRAGSRTQPAGGTLQAARLGEVTRGEMPNAEHPRSGEWRLWNGIQLAFSVALVATLAYAMWTFATTGLGLRLEPWQRTGMRVMLVIGLVGFVVRSVILWLRMTGPPPRG